MFPSSAPKVVLFSPLPAKSGAMSIFINCISGVTYFFVFFISFTYFVFLSFPAKSGLVI